MASFHLLNILILLCLFISTGLTDGERTVLPNLREFAERGTYGRFAVPAGPVFNDFQRRKSQDSLCGNDVQLNILQVDGDIVESSNDTAEIDIVVFEVDDFALKRELSCEMRDRLNILKGGVALQTPYVSGNDNGIVLNVIFAEGQPTFFNPYPTNMGIIKPVDSIRETDGGIVTVYKGDDVMVLEIRKDEECRKKQEQELEESMDELVGGTFHVTNYPLDFDFWGCSSLGWNVSFCQVLKERQCEIQRFGGDVCTRANITNAHYCPASMTLVNATGYFLDEFPFLPSFRIESFAGDTYDKLHSNGIVFPCLS